MRKRKRKTDEINYWQSNADLITGFAFVLLLIIMLLLLYLIQIPEYSLPYDQAGDSYNVDDLPGEADDDGEHYDETQAVAWREGTDDDDDGGGSGDGEEETQPEEYEYPFPSSGGDDWGKAAVYATVIDGETERAVREAGITFELYEEQIQGDGGAKRFLNTYYPVKTEYRSFETTEDGVFYLPEKIEEGHYYFKQITELEGYDPAQSVYFDVDDTYDWPDPFVVSIEVFPSKNFIAVELEDADTHEPVGEGTFQISAEEDVLTSDGTVRFVKNEVADTVTVNEEGRGQSVELYLGNYVVSQKEPPRYYASIEEPVSVEVARKNGADPEPVRFLCEKTKISLHLTDELYTNIPLEGAEFALTCSGEPEFSRTAATDAQGRLLFTDLDGNKTYTLRQVSAPQNYKYTDSGTEIYVDASGRIEGQIQTQIELTNYISRVTVGITDALFRSPVSGTSMALYNESGEQIRIWTSSGAAETFENLPEGSYYVLLNGDEDQKYEFYFTEDAALQTAAVTIWTMQDTVAVLAGVAAVLLCFAVGVRIVRRKKPSGQ